MKNNRVQMTMFARMTSIALMICILLTLLVIPASAEESVEEVSIRESDVFDDLKSSTIKGQPFNLENYKFNEAGKIQLLNFVEYCYSYRSNQRGEYGLFIYIYNPAALNIDTKSLNNKIQMAVKYDEAGNPIDYEKFTLRYINRSVEGEYRNLFYKFEIMDHEVDETTFADRVKADERRYDISGFEIYTTGTDNAVDYTVGGTFKFKGYAKGCGFDPTVESSLTCEVENLETVTLDVKHTFYRTSTSAKGGGYQNQLDSVYFAVPKRLFDQYGSLQRIKAEWYEYKTKDIVVTTHEDAYNRVYPHLGEYTGDLDWLGLSGTIDDARYGFADDIVDTHDSYVCGWGWNLGSDIINHPEQYLFYLFYTENLETYDPYADPVEIGGVSSNTLYEYIRSYDKTFMNGTLPIKDGTISADLFESDIDDYRKIDNELGKIDFGYSYYDFDADINLGTLESWSSTDPSFWSTMIEFGFWNALTNAIPEEINQDVAPIYIVKDSDLTGSDQEICERLLINYNDVDDFKDYYEDATTVNGATDEEMVVVLFRFALTDYYSVPLDIYDHDHKWPSNGIEMNMAYQAWESVFLDFDIIQLTFQKDGEYHVIPVVSSPIDIVNDITPPTFSNDESMLRALILLIVLILLIILLWPIIGPFVGPVLGFLFKLIVKIVMLLLKIAWAIISFPFKLGAALDDRRKAKEKSDKQELKQLRKEQKKRKKEHPEDFADEPVNEQHTDNIVEPEEPPKRRRGWSWKKDPPADGTGSLGDGKEN